MDTFSTILVNYKSFKQRKHKTFASVYAKFRFIYLSGPPPIGKLFIVDKIPSRTKTFLINNNNPTTLSTTVNIQTLFDCRVTVSRFATVSAYLVSGRC